MMRLLLLFMIIGISGCGSFEIKEPRESNFIGEWVSIGLVPYARLSYSTGGKGILVFAYEIEESKVYTIRNFTVSEDEFTIRIDDPAGEENGAILIGMFIGDRLRLRDSDDDTYEHWFVRSENIPTLSKKADEAIQIYRKSEHNQPLNATP